MQELTLNLPQILVCKESAVVTDHSGRNGPLHAIGRLDRQTEHEDRVRLEVSLTDVQLPAGRQCQALGVT